MKVIITRLLYILAAIVLVSVLAILYFQSANVNSSSYSEIIKVLRELKQIDAEWNVDVLRAKTGLDGNYDKVASPLPLIDSFKAVLENKTNIAWGDRKEANGRLLPLLNIYVKLMEQKIATTERFKSQNAILRNSLRFLPVAVADLNEAATQNNVTPSIKSNLERALNALLTDTMIYSISPDEILRLRIIAGMSQINELALTLPPVVRELSEVLNAHVETVLKQQQLGSKLISELSALPTAKAIDALSDANAEEQEKLVVGFGFFNIKLEEMQKVFSQTLIVYSGFLLILLAYAAWRVYKYYLDLNKANTALNQANYALKESQVQLVQTEKMSALGQLVAGIAHEINTPLAYVKGIFGVLSEQLHSIEHLALSSQNFSHLIRSSKRDNLALNSALIELEANVKNVLDDKLVQEMATLLKDGVYGIEKISEIVLNLKNFSRLDRSKISDFALSAGLDSTLQLANHLINKDQVIIKKEYDVVPNITCSPSQINQVFLNIITNAIQAMPVRSEDNIITLRIVMESDDMVRVEIQDNGNGIPKEVLPKIFDPFFTTKPIGKGSGMGLSISYKIIQEHGGKILVNTEAGVGTIFSILLPINFVHTETSAVIDDALFIAA